MVRHEHVLTVFVATPGDVGDERTRLEEVISELNVTWSRVLGVRLDLVRWETHAYPGIGQDAQDVINQELPSDYDIFIGVMWCRYGSATGRAGSGTVEEFERAKARYNADPKSVKFMMYFSDAPIRPSRLDSTQLENVSRFRESLGDEGFLYWRYTNHDQFEKLIRLHLTRQIQSWKTENERPPSDEPDSDPTLQVPSDDEDGGDSDLGILDQMEIFEDRFEQLTTITKRITVAIQNIGTKISERTVQLDELPRDSQGNANRNAVKRLISMAASDMDDFTTRMEAEIPIFSKSLNDGMNALILASTMSVDLASGDDSVESVTEGLNGINTLLDALTVSKQSTIEFRDNVAGLPRMTSELNKSKRGAVGVLDKLIAELSNGQSLLREADAVVRSLLVQ